MVSNSCATAPCCALSFCTASARLLARACTPICHTPLTLSLPLAGTQFRLAAGEAKLRREPFRAEKDLG